MPLTQYKRLFRRSQPSALANSKLFVRPYINTGYGHDRSDGVNSLQELIEFNALHNSDHIFCIQLVKKGSEEENSEEGGFGLPRRITFIQLLGAVERASAWFVKSGITSGRSQRKEDIAPVGLFLSSDVTIFIYIAALMRVGTPVLLLSARLNSVALQNLIEETSPSCILVNSQILKRTALEAIELSASSSRLKYGKPAVVHALSYEPFLNPRDPDLAGSPVPEKYVRVGHEDANAIIFHSSGTTGLPKPVYHSHAYLMLIATCHSLHEYHGSRGSLCTLPLYHGYALLPTSLSMVIGMPLILMPSSTVPTGHSTMDVLELCKPGFLFTVPSILEEMIGLPESRGLEVLRRLDIVPAGGAPMKESVGDQLRKEGVRYLNHWGCTELGPMTPIEVPDVDVDWRWLRPRADHSLRITPFDANGSVFQISGRPPGWKTTFQAQDALVIDPLNSRQYKLAGRQDNLILLSTGEKVLPTAIESELCQHPQVKEVCAFGEGQVALGILVELKQGTDQVSFLDELRPYLSRGNASMDKHGKVQPEMVIFTSEDTKPLMRTDKNSLARKATIAAFSEEIASCYSRSRTGSPHSCSFPSLRSVSREQLPESIREIVTSILDYEHIDNSADLFEVGMDSSQATRLRRTLEASLNSPSSSPSPNIKLETNFCFRYSSVRKLDTAIARILAGQSSRAVDEGFDRVSKMREILNPYLKEAEATISQSAAQEDVLAPTKGNKVLITGSTGSLGCYLLARLAADSGVTNVYCLSRPHSTEDLLERQRRLMDERGVRVNDSLWEKVKIFKADFSHEHFGLGQNEYQELLGVTHIIHNAWPVNFNRTLPSFERQIQTVVHLTRLAHLSGLKRRSQPPTRLAFTSSIAVAGHYSSGRVPEMPMSPESTAPIGYAEAKWVAEELLLGASKHREPPKAPGFQSSIIRVGQISGSGDTGAWNQSEHIPLVIKGSQLVGYLPAIEGTLSWLPVNRTADIVCDLLFSKRFCQFYHIENPSRQPWKDVLQRLGELLCPANPIPIIPFPEWLARIRELGDEGHQITHLLDFLEGEFTRIGAGGTILDTTNSRTDSATLATSEALGRSLLKIYADTWRTTKLNA